MGGECVKCLICSNVRANVVYDVREMMFGSRELFRYFQCGRCQCLQIGTIPDDLSSHYPEHYYSYADIASRRGGSRNRAEVLRNRYAVSGRGVAGRLLFRLFPAPQYRSLSRVLIRNDSSILDVGCGQGQLLYNLREFGFERLLGIDPYIDSDISYANGLTVLRKSIDEVDGKWDLIILNHSFEHVTNPLETLERISKLLHANATCLIRMPTVSSYAWRHYGVDWVQLDAPRHLFLHSIESMRFLAMKAALVVDEVVYDSTSFQFWGSELYKRDMPLVGESPISSPVVLFPKVEIGQFARRARRLNKRGEGDQAAFYLKKVNS